MKSVESPPKSHGTECGGLRLELKRGRELNDSNNWVVKRQQTQLQRMTAELQAETERLQHKNAELQAETERHQSTNAELQEETARSTQLQKVSNTVWSMYTQLVESNLAKVLSPILSGQHRVVTCIVRVWCSSLLWSVLSNCSRFVAISAWLAARLSAVVDTSVMASICSVVRSILVNTKSTLSASVSLLVTCTASI
eukprot:3133100-Rhodomonas_salina.1